MASFIHHTNLLSDTLNMLHDNVLPPHDTWIGHIKGAFYILIAHSRDQLNPLVRIHKINLPAGNYFWNEEGSNEERERREGEWWCGAQF